MNGIMHEELLYWQLNGQVQRALLYDGQDEEELLRTFDNSRFGYARRRCDNCSERGTLAGAEA